MNKRHPTDDTQIVRKRFDQSVFVHSFLPNEPQFKVGSVHQQNEKATRQQGGLLFSRENSSNGGKDFRQNSLAQNLMSRKRRVSSKFWEINVFSFNDLQNRSTRA